LVSIVSCDYKIFLIYFFPGIIKEKKEKVLAFSFISQFTGAGLLFGY